MAVMALFLISNFLPAGFKILIYDNTKYLSKALCDPKHVLNEFAIGKSCTPVKTYF